MKNIFLRVALLIVFAFAFNSCSHESISEELQMEKDNNTMLQRDPADSNNNGSNVFTHSDADNPDGEASGGGGSSTQCVKNEYSNISGNSDLYVLTGRKVLQSQSNSMTFPDFYVDYSVSYRKNSAGNYYITTQNFSNAQNDCGAGFLQSISYNNRSATISGNQLFVTINFTATYRIPSTGTDATPVIYNITYSDTKIFPLPN